jgi:Leucine-rich repeat (LRR) protein
LNNNKLETLDLAVNKIEKFEHLDHLSNTLKELWLNWNKIEETEENKAYLTNFKTLETLYLADNPLAN